MIQTHHQDIGYRSLPPLKVIFIASTRSPDMRNVDDLGTKETGTNNKQTTDFGGSFCKHIPGNFALNQPKASEVRFGCGLGVRGPCHHQNE